LQKLFSIEMIEVCCALICDGQHVLAVQRGPESNHPWLWEFPGGKILPEETPEQCIVREIEEELLIRVEVLYPLSPVEFAYPNKKIKLIPFVCRIVSGEITLTEHVAQKWFSLPEWQTIDWSGADRELILKNQEGLYVLLKNDN
jgi:8-oxo-dGTP diphosphatase